jgi:hypothetical protein
MIRAAALAVVLLLPQATLAQKRDDDPIPYSDDDDERRSLPRKSEPTRELPQETAVEEDDRRVSLTSQDDPNIGLSLELVQGVLLLESSRGGGVDPRYQLGVRFTWEFGRLIPDEFLRELFFADVTWLYAWSRGDGTTEVNTNVNYHDFTFAPAFALPLGKKSPVSFFGQLGLGVAYQTSSLNVSATTTDIAGAKLLVQYGLGLRFRPAIVEGDWMRLSFRLELTRFRRGYMDDTLVGGSIGLTF